MVSAWLLSILVLGFVTQSWASLKALEDEINLLKGAFHRQTDETNERVKTLQKQVDDLKRENFDKDQGKTDIDICLDFHLQCKSPKILFKYFIDLVKIQKQ